MHLWSFAEWKELFLLLRVLMHLRMYLKWHKEMIRESDNDYMCLSGRGDKDVNTVQKYLNGEETNK